MFLHMQTEALQERLAEKTVRFLELLRSFEGILTRDLYDCFPRHGSELHSLSDSHQHLSTVMYRSC